MDKEKEDQTFYFRLINKMEKLFWDYHEGRVDAGETLKRMIKISKRLKIKIVTAPDKPRSEL